MSARSEGRRLIKVKPQRNSSSPSRIPSAVLAISDNQDESEDPQPQPTNSSRQEIDNNTKPNENPPSTPVHVESLPILSTFDDEMDHALFKSMPQKIQSSVSGRSAIGGDCMTPVEEITMLDRDSLGDIKYQNDEAKVSPSLTDKDDNQDKKLSSKDEILNASAENDTLNNDCEMMEDHERQEEINESKEEKNFPKYDEEQRNASPDMEFIEVEDQADASISKYLEKPCTKEDLDESSFKNENIVKEDDPDSKITKDVESDFVKRGQSKTILVRDLSSRLSSSKSIYSRGRSAQTHEDIKQLSKNFDSFQKFNKNVFVDPSYTRLQTPADMRFDKLALSSSSKPVTPDSKSGETTPDRPLSNQSSPYQSQELLSRKSDDIKSKVGSNLSLSGPIEKQKTQSRNEVGYTKVATNRTQVLRENRTKGLSKVEYALGQGKGTLESAKESQGQLKQATDPQITTAKHNKVRNPPVKSKSNLSGKMYQIKKDQKTATTTGSTTSNNNTNQSTNIIGKPTREADKLFKKFNSKENFTSRLLEMAHNGEWTNLDELIRNLERNNEELHIADEDTGISLLMLAAKDNRIMTMDKLIELNVDINAQATDGRSALHFVSLYGKDDGLRMLLNRKADPNIIGGVNNQLPLHMACYRTFHGASLMVQNLLRTTKDGRLTSDKNGHIPLHIAVASKNVSSCKELLVQQTNEQLNCPMANLETVLHMACKMKDADLATVLLEHKAPVNVQNIYGQTPLHVSVQENSIQLVKILHQYGASIELTDNDDKTPLHIATEQGLTQIVEYLAEKQRADIKGRTRNGDTLVHLAASSGQPDVALVFLKRGLFIHMPNKFGATCLHAAAKSGHSGVIQTLISKGAMVDARTKDDRTPLHVAAEFCNSAAVETLIGNGATVDAKGGKNNETPLHIASGTIGGDECVEILIKSGAEVNSVQENLETPLHIAACSENLKVMELLIRDGADMTLLSKNGENPLHLSVRSCHIDSVRYLLDRYSERYPENNLSYYVNQANQEGETSLHYACELAKCQAHYDDEDVDIAKLLLKSGGDVNLKTKTTLETPIHYCAKSGSHDIARALFEYLGPAKTSSAINKLSSNGSSGLLVACQEGHLETVKAFLAHSARVDVFEEQGKAPLHLAAENGHYEVAEELVRHRAYAGAKTKMGLTPLHYAAQNGHARLAILIADKHKSSMEAVTLDRQTPLHLAAQNGQKAVVSCLLRMKANAEARTNKGQTALHLAAENDHSDVVKMLLKSKPDLVVSANSDGMTCAHIAASKGRLAVVEELMRFNKEAVLTAKNKTNESTPLQLAVIGGHVDVVQSLMKAGASATEENSDGMSALMLAARHGHLKILDILKDLLPLDTVSQKTGYTALHVASKYGQQEFVRELLNHVSHDLLTTEPQLDFMKVLLDLNSDYGFTALHLAAEFGHETLVRFLLNSTKIMSDAKSTLQGVTALHLAASSGHADVASLLLSKLSVLISVKDKKGRLPLHLAAYNGRLNMVTLLLGQGTYVDADDQNGWTPLHHASKAGHLDVVQLLVSSGSNTKLITKDGKPAASLAASASHTHVLSFLMKQDLDTRHFLEDNKFAFDLMELGKLNDQEPVAEFILASRVPAETSAKLSKIFRQLALKEKERANDLEEAAEYCDNLALELTAIACNIVHAGVLLNAIEDKEVTFLDLLIDCEQKEVIAYPTIQTYLSEVWTGYLSQWSSWKMLVLLICMLLCPPFWIIISLPLDIRISKIPVVKFMSHLVSHMYLIILFILCTVYPTYNLWDAPDNAPAWSEWLLLAWLSGLVVEQLTNNENPSGLGWLRLFLLVVSTMAVVFEIAAYSVGEESGKSVLIYIRNQWFAFAMLLSFVLLMEFLSFHHLFGPWAIIIRELMKDLLRFIVVLVIFMLGFTFQISAAYMPVFRSTNDTSSDPGACSPTVTSTDEVATMQSPKLTFEMLFFALFGLIDMGNLPCLSNQPWWSIYLLKSIIGIYMLITFIMLVNLLIAMMSDTYADIQAQSDIEWKFGRAKLFQNMNKTSSAPAPIILVTKLITYITILHRYRSAGCVYNTQPFVNEIEGLDSDLTNQSAENDVLSPDVEDSTGGKCCPCLKKKNSGESGKRTVTKPPQDKLEEIINWKVVSEKYLSITKKNQAEEIED